MLRKHFNPNQYKSRLREFKKAGTHIHAGVIIAVMAFVGFVGVYGIKAATYYAFSEAEGGTITGNAALTGDATAAGDNSVAFGKNTVPLAPANIKAFTGGTSIAIRWDSSTVTGDTIKQYNIIPNGSQVATVTPGFHADFPEQDGNGYIDNNVSVGQSYNYQVQAVSTSGGVSAVSGSVSASRPSSTTAMPNITVDTSTAPDLAAYMQSVKTFLQIWYPKMGDLLARPDYTPSANIKIIAQQGYSGLAGTVGGVITISADYARQNPYDFGVWMHESTHILQLYPTNPVGWATEGMADWTREYLLHDRDPYPPRPGESYTQGYAQGSYFLNWIQTTYAPNFIHKLNVVLHNNTYTASFFPNNTGGRTIDQLWAELTSKSYGAPGTIKGIANKCLDVANGTQANGTKTQLQACNGLDHQQWIVAYDNIAQAKNGTFALHAYTNFCLDIQYAGTANGTITWLYKCSNDIAQQWRVGPNGSLINPNSGKCLDTTNGGSNDGNQLIINTCNGSASQRWTVPS